MSHQDQPHRLYPAPGFHRSGQLLRHGDWCWNLQHDWNLATYDAHGSGNRFLMQPFVRPGSPHLHTMELLPTELRFYAEGNNRTSVLRAAFRFGPVDYIEMDGDGFIRFWGGRRILYTITQVYHGQYLHDDHIPAISDFWIFSGPLYARSLYVIAHRCNDVPKISQSLALGCNDIEIDAIRINGRWYADHGELAAIDRILLVQRTFMRDWADGAAAAYGQFRHQWLVLIVDLKNYAETADLYLQLRERLPHLFIIFSVSHQDSAQGAFGPIWPLQSDRDGYAVDGNNNWGHVVYWFQSRGITRSWYGNGLNAAMNGAILGPNVWPSLAEASRARAPVGTRTGPTPGRCGGSRSATFPAGPGATRSW